jgi:parvulin-like peptidyl-prolyl isomerase
MKMFGALLIGGILTIAAPAWAQNEVSSLSAQHVSEQAPNQAQVASSDAVITIHGQCEPGKQSGTDGKSCAMIVTREEFEKLVNSMNVTNKALSQETERNLAETYAEYLALERPAVEAKLDQTPQFAEIMRWWRLRTLADMYRGKLQAEFAHPSTEEIHAYYTERLPSYERIQLERVLVPREKTMQDDKATDDKALQMAQAARERLVKGESPALVQKDIYTQLKSDAAPVTNLGSLGRSNFPKDEVDELFALKPGEVSKVEKEASYVIYKVNGKESLSEESQKEEIAREIAQQKFSDAMRAINESAQAEFNDVYLGPHVAPALRSHAGTTNPHQ